METAARNRIGHTAPDRRTYGAGLSGSEPVLAAFAESKAILGTLPGSEFQAWWPMKPPPHRFRRGSIGGNL